MVNNNCKVNGHKWSPAFCDEKFIWMWNKLVSSTMDNNFLLQKNSKLLNKAAHGLKDISRIKHRIEDLANKIDKIEDTFKWTDKYSNSRPTEVNEVWLEKTIKKQQKIIESNKIAISQNRERLEKLQDITHDAGKYAECCNTINGIKKHEEELNGTLRKLAAKLDTLESTLHRPTSPSSHLNSATATPTPSTPASTASTITNTSSSSSTTTTPSTTKTTTSTTCTSTSSTNTSTSSLAQSITASNEKPIPSIVKLTVTPAPSSHTPIPQIRNPSAISSPSRPISSSSLPYGGTRDESSGSKGSGGSTLPGKNGLTNEYYPESPDFSSPQVSDSNSIQVHHQDSQAHLIIHDASKALQDLKEVIRDREEFIYGEDVKKHIRTNNTSSNERKRMNARLDKLTKEMHVRIDSLQSALLDSGKLDNITYMRELMREFENINIDCNRKITFHYRNYIQNFAGFEQRRWQWGFNLARDGILTLAWNQTQFNLSILRLRRKYILKGNRCKFCAKYIKITIPSEQYTHGDQAQIDHLIPKSQWSCPTGPESNKYINLVQSCSDCNNTKGTSSACALWEQLREQRILNLSHSCRPCFNSMPAMMEPPLTTGKGHQTKKQKKVPQKVSFSSDKPINISEESDCPSIALKERVLAKWKDENIYNAIIHNITESGYLVNYSDFDVLEELPASRILKITSKEDSPSPRALEVPKQPLPISDDDSIQSSCELSSASNLSFTNTSKHIDDSTLRNVDNNNPQGVHNVTQHAINNSVPSMKPNQNNSSLPVIDDMVHFTAHSGIMHKGRTAQFIDKDHCNITTSNLGTAFCIPLQAVSLTRDQTKSPNTARNIPSFLPGDKVEIFDQQGVTKGTISSISKDNCVTARLRNLTTVGNIPEINIKRIEPSATKCQESIEQWRSDFQRIHLANQDSPLASAQVHHNSRSLIPHQERHEDTQLQYQQQKEPKAHPLSSRPYENCTPASICISGLRSSKGLRYKVWGKFAQHGDIAEVSIINSRENNNYVIGFITYFNQGDAQEAIYEKNGKYTEENDRLNVAWARIFSDGSPLSQGTGQQLNYLKECTSEDTHSLYISGIPTDGHSIHEGLIDIFLSNGVIQNAKDFDVVDIKIINSNKIKARFASQYSADSTYYARPSSPSNNLRISKVIPSSYNLYKNQKSTQHQDGGIQRW